MAIERRNGVGDSGGLDIGHTLCSHSDLLDDRGIAAIYYGIVEPVHSGEFGFEVDCSRRRSQSFQTNTGGSTVGLKLGTGDSHPARNRTQSLSRSEDTVPTIASGRQRCGVPLIIPVVVEGADIFAAGGTAGARSAHQGPVVGHLREALLRRRWRNDV